MQAGAAQHPKGPPHLLLPLRQAVRVRLALRCGWGCTGRQPARRPPPPLGCRALGKERSLDAGKGRERRRRNLRRGRRGAGGGTYSPGERSDGSRQHSRAASSTIKSSLKSLTPPLMALSSLPLPGGPPAGWGCSSQRSDALQGAAAGAAVQLSGAGARDFEAGVQGKRPRFLNSWQRGGSDSRAPGVNAEVWRRRCALGSAPAISRRAGGSRFDPFVPAAANLMLSPDLAFSF